MAQTDTNQLMSNGKPSRTTNPIHFEDLDPKRFEDLVRELIYDFRDWQTIEATGKGGTDDGFDIRAFERESTTSVDDDGNEVIHPREGNLWMVQCKREKVIPPSKIKKILEDIDPKNPPYGYILAAATDFSKKAYDAFRDGLTELGVLEFQLWGKATLETELHQPKNDRILFTFFGISNVRRRQSRGTEIRSEITNKNKVMRMLGDNPEHKWILARDSKDREYPYKDKYNNFDEQPRWKEFEVIELHPRGVIVRLKHSFAYMDEATGVFDVADPAIVHNNPYNRSNQTAEERKLREKVGTIKDYWECLPYANQVMFHLYGVIRYKDMLAIDVIGDTWNEVPHIFVDFVDGSPISGTLANLERGASNFGIGDMQRKDIFPDVFPKPIFGTINEAEPLALPETLAEQYVNFRGDLKRLFDAEGRYDHLQQTDVAVVRFGQKDERFVQITHRFELTKVDMEREHPNWMWDVQQQIGREPNNDDVYKVIEFRNCYRHQWER